MAKPIALTDADFEQAVLNADTPIVVDFWAPWCGPCRAIAPILDKLAGEYEGRLTIAKVNTDDHQRWAGEYKVQGIPTLIVFKAGQEVERLVGASPEQKYRDVFDRILSQGSSTAKPIALTDADFEQTVLKAGTPVVVDFWAPWCGPCRAIAPILDKLAGEYEGRLTIAKVNTDTHQRWANEYGVKGIPTLIVFKEGQAVERLVGSRPEHVYRDVFNRVIG